MKKGKIFKSIAFVLGLAASMSTMTACTKKTSKDETITLKYLMPGPGHQQDSEEVYRAFNEKLHEYLPNVNVDIECISTAEYNQQYLLMQTGGTQMDIVNTYGLSFATEVKNGSFLDITELLDEYGKETKEALPEWLFDYMKVDGVLYGVPSYQMLGSGRALITQKEFADKWLDVEGLKKELYNNSYFTDKAAKILDTYMENLSKNGKVFYGAAPYNETVMNGYEAISDNFVIDKQTHKVYYKFETDAIKNQYKRHAEWFKKGYIRQDALSCTDESNKKGMGEGYVLWDVNYTPWVDKTTSKDGTEFITIPVNDHYIIGNSNAAGGTAISAGTKYPEEAMRVINLLQTNKELYNLLVYGIEGKHYTKISEERIETPYGEQGKSSDMYGIYKWIVGNTKLAYLTQAQPDNFKEWVFNEVNTSEDRSELIGFVLKNDSIADILTQLAAIKDEYMKTLATGALKEGWEAYYNEWMRKIKVAGVDTAREEIQKQVDEFLKK